MSIKINSFSDLSQREQVLVATLVATDVTLKAASWHFLYHEPARKIRGPKWAWAIVTSLIGTFGPMAFLIFGRK